ncbi:hypothetical protein OWR29_14770 [Actinoplanes sp. Pm04-4]|uniref:Uncharacterized protein n=1 Tax=Paractinoplanes pyxinae TaxID=2997416 RepID=A0ABT4B0Q5_9ACTN|nr:hypothetical protein [Actinoplanes pyxinae]MCY1139260.1 hypothetical protein [Actinoplanes pyxinae]
MTTQHEDVSRRLSGAEEAAVERHADYAEAIRGSFHRLRTGLDLAHGGSTVGAQEWGSYVAALDRGLDELDRELAHAADLPAAETKLVTHASKLELAGWRLRFSLPGAAKSDPDGVRERLAAAEDEVDSYAAGRSSAPDVQRRIDDLRDVRADI